MIKSRFICIGGGLYVKSRDFTTEKYEELMKKVKKRNKNGDYIPTNLSYWLSDTLDISNNVKNKSKISQKVTEKSVKKLKIVKLLRY